MIWKHTKCAPVMHDDIVASKQWVYPFFCIKPDNIAIFASTILPLTRVTLSDQMVICQYVRDIAAFSLTKEVIWFYPKYMTHDCITWERMGVILIILGFHRQKLHIVRAVLSNICRHTTKMWLCVLVFSRNIWLRYGFTNHVCCGAYQTKYLGYIRV